VGDINGRSADICRFALARAQNDFSNCFDILDKIDSYCDPQDEETRVVNTTARVNLIVEAALDADVSSSISKLVSDFGESELTIVEAASLYKYAGLDNEAKKLVASSLISDDSKSLIYQRFARHSSDNGKILTACDEVRMVPDYENKPNLLRFLLKHQIAGELFQAAGATAKKLRLLAGEPIAGITWEVEYQCAVKCKAPSAAFEAIRALRDIDPDNAEYAGHEALTLLYGFKDRSSAEGILKTIKVDNLSVSTIRQLKRGGLICDADSKDDDESHL
jgi:hypothetical protein